MKRPKLNGHAAIAEAVGNSLNEYLEKLDGEPADNAWAEALALLATNRNTLRAKLDKYKIKPYQA